MSAFSPQSSQTLPIFAGGVALLIIVAAGFSGLSSGLIQNDLTKDRNAELRGNIQNNEITIRDLRRDIERQRGFAEPVKPEADLEISAEELTQMVTLLEGEIEKLAQALPTEQRALEAIRTKSSEHRARVRNRLWTQFQGTTLTDEHFLHEALFENATVKRVQESGLLVTHASGVARIPVASLSGALREQLDLTVWEGVQATAQLHARDAREKQRRTDLVTKRAESKPSLFSKEEREAEVLKYQQLINSAEATARIARYNDENSSSRLVADQSETWQERAARFEKLAARYREMLTKLFPKEAQKPE